jgi:hypothetical protein
LQIVFRKRRLVSGGDAPVNPLGLFQSLTALRYLLGV